MRDGLFLDMRAREPQHDSDYRYRASRPTIPRFSCKFSNCAGAGSGTLPLVATACREAQTQTRTRQVGKRVRRTRLVSPTASVVEFGSSWKEVGGSDGPWGCILHYHTPLRVSLEPGLGTRDLDLDLGLDWGASTLYKRRRTRAESPLHRRR